MIRPIDVLQGKGCVVLVNAIEDGYLKGSIKSISFSDVIKRIPYIGDLAHSLPFVGDVLSAESLAYSVTQALEGRKTWKEVAKEAAEIMVSSALVTTSKSVILSKLKGSSKDFVKKWAERKFADPVIETGLNAIANYFTNSNPLQENSRAIVNWPYRDLPHHVVVNWKDWNNQRNGEYEYYTFANFGELLNFYPSAASGLNTYLNMSRDVSIKNTGWINIDFGIPPYYA